MTSLPISTDHTLPGSIEELDVVRLSHRIVTECGVAVEAGSRGTVVAVYGGGEAFCIEFIDPVQALATVGREAFDAVPEETIARLISSTKPFHRRAE